MCVCVCTARLCESFKIPKGKPRRFALFELVPKWYKPFPPDHFGETEKNDSTMLSNTTSTAKSCAEDQILEHLILRARFCIFVLNDS